MIELDARRLPPADRLAVIQAVRTAVARGDITVGQGLRVLRAAHLRMNRDRFSKMVGISKRELAKIETDGANSTVATLNRAFGPFRLRVGLVGAPATGTARPPEPLSEDRYATLLEALLAAIDQHSRRPSSRRPAKKRSG